MKKLILVFIIILIAVILILRQAQTKTQNITSVSNQSQGNNNLPHNQTDVPRVTVIAENLDTPWAIDFLPNRKMLVTERKGTVKLIDTNDNNKVTEIGKISDAKEIGEGGLLGVAIHPEYSTNNYVYFYYTYEQNGESTMNRVARMTFKDNKLTNEKIIVDKIPGASNHNGGRIKFESKGNLLYIGTGDAQEPSLAQNKNSLAGKILRVYDDGRPLEGNNNNPAWSYGHRNVQGLALSENGQWWASEHGSSAYDEINVIRKNENYGWPMVKECYAGSREIKGDNGSFDPQLCSETDTWAPGAITFVKDDLFFTGLRGQALYHHGDDGIKEHFKGEFGRLREIVLGPDGMFYITTSNRDGRAIPKSRDDKIIRVNPNKL